LEDQDVVLTTYGTLAADFSSMKHSALFATRWLRVCLDEGHLIKNHRTIMAKAAYCLAAKRKWIISGTPIQNNLGELWCLLYWLGMEPYCSSRSVFKQQIERPVKHGDERGMLRLQTLIQTICMRRTKADQVNGKPIVQLPNKNVIVRKLEFNEEERMRYNAMEQHGREIIIRLLRRHALLKNYAHVFAIMMRLRQLCCHKELLPERWRDEEGEEALRDILETVRAQEEAEKAAAAAAAPDEDVASRLAEQLRDMIRDGMTDECSICLSDLTKAVITPCAHVYCKDCIIRYIEGVRPPPAHCPLCRSELNHRALLEAAPPDEEEDLTAAAGANGKNGHDPFADIVVNISSTKVNAVLKELAGIRRDFPSEKTVVVSQFTSFLSVIQVRIVCVCMKRILSPMLVQPLLKEEGYNFTRLDGTMSMKERSDVIADFQDSSPESPTVLLLSLRAGGVGLNLTAGSRMLLLDPAWNPSTEHQCFDRIHRLGQTKDVTVIKFVMSSSIEERMLEVRKTRIQCYYED